MDIRIYNRALSEAEIQALYYDSQVEMTRCFPSLPSKKNLVLTVQELKKFIDNNLPSLSNVYDPLLDDSVKKQIMDELDFGGKIDTGGHLGIHYSLERGVETNLETLLSAFLFDGSRIFDNGYGGFVIREVGEAHLGLPVVGVKGRS